MNVSISRNGTEIGEWTEDQVRALLKEGQLLATDYYWKEGMTEWAELSKMIKPPLPAPAPSPNKSEPSVINGEGAGQKALEALVEKGIGRLVYICVMLPLVVCISGASSVINSSFPYDRQSAGAIEVLVALVVLALVLFTMFLRLKNIGNSNTRAAVFTVLAAIPILAIPVSLFCLFCPTGYMNKIKT